MNMYTRNGIPVQGLVFDNVSRRYVGYVGAKLMTWDHLGRRSNVRTSKYDLINRPTFYFNVYRRGGRILVQNTAYTNLGTAIQNRPANYIKTIECAL
jgi:hypothetical protein